MSSTNLSTTKCQFAGTPTIGGDTGDGNGEDSSLFPGYIKIRRRQRKLVPGY